MTVQEFINKYNGKKIDFDGHFGAQCVDVFRQYCKDVLNIPHTGSVVGAKDLYEKYEQLPKEKQYLKKIPRDFIVPQEGDVVIFGASKNNKYGHVAIVLEAEPSKLKVFEQDGFRQDGCKISSYSYTNVLGFLRKR